MLFILHVHSILFTLNLLEVHLICFFFSEMTVSGVSDYWSFWAGQITFICIPHPARWDCLHLCLYHSFRNGHFRWSPFCHTWDFILPESYLLLIWVKQLVVLSFQEIMTTVLHDPCHSILHVPSKTNVEEFSLSLCLFPYQPFVSVCCSILLDRMHHVVALSQSAVSGMC